MQINLDWLSDFVDVPAFDTLPDQLASVGIEVDEVHNPGAAVDGVVVADVLSVEPHPNADKLKVCQVHNGIETVQVVCGAPNVAAGQRVAHARVGSRLSFGAIGKRKIRGVESHGMLCGKEELGLEDKSDGIWELPTTFALGAAVMKEANVTPTLTLGLTPNRPDLLSHIGVAREVAAATGKRPKAPKWRVVEKGPDIGTMARVVVEEPSGCKRYCARVVRGLKVGPSPDWLRRRLEAVGQRSINNVVDATNYVLMELGQPLHAFDLSKLSVEDGRPTIRVRRARAQEPLRTLDDVDRTLEPDDLVIADEHRVLAIAGIMGGADSEVGATTTTALLESAYFDPSRVRRTSKRLGLHTEASHRFERGADPGMAQRAVDRCAQLLTEVAGGEVAKGLIDVAQKWDVRHEISLSLDRIAQVLGLPLGAEAVVQLLEPLEVRCVARNESGLRFEIPTFRPDLEREIDLIEELARRHGYERIPVRLPDASSEYFHEPLVPSRSDIARDAMLKAGCAEVVTYGFGSPSVYAPFASLHGDCVRLLNPLGEEMSAMRTTLLPGLLTVAQRNQRHGRRDVRLFEVGRTFRACEPRVDGDEFDRDLPIEEVRLGILLYGARHMERWYEGGERVDFSDLAGAIEVLSDAFDPEVPVARRKAAVEGFNPHCCAELHLNGVVVGVAGQLHPDVLSKWDAAGPVFAAEVSLDGLARAPVRRVSHRPLPKFPGTRRDVAVVAERTLPAESLRLFIEAEAGGAMGAEVVERVRLFDVYEGKPIPPTHVSLAFAIDYRSRERTLTDAEVGAAFDGVLDKLRQQFGVEVRA